MRKTDCKFPKRKKSAKKGDAGKVLIIGGSENYVGAPILAGIAALRAGVDWVTIASSQKVAWAINTYSPDLVTLKLKGPTINTSHLKILLQESKEYDAILIGNGIGTQRQTKLFIKKFIQQCKKPIVIDADAIKAIAIQDCRNTILTPHLKELDILLKNSKLKRSQLKTYLKNNIILLKGPTDTIMTKEETILNKTGNPGMAKAGTGDVLAGLCVSYLAQTKNPLQSAKNSAYLNGKLGDILLKKKRGYTYLASDLLEELSSFSK